MSRIGHAWALLLAIGLLSGVARAEDDAERFRNLVAEATNAYAQGNFRRAAELAEEAYRIKANPRLLYNVARAREAMGDEPGAIDAYERYLAAEPNAPDKGIVTGRIEALKRSVEERATLERRKRELEQTEKRPESSNDRRDEPPAPPARPRTLPWVTIGVGGAVLVSGAVFALLSRKSYDDGESASGERAAELDERGDRFTTLANVAFVAGAAITVGGAGWLFLSASPSTSSASIRLRREF